MTKTLKEIKDEYAVKNGFISWDALLISTFDFNIEAHEYFIKHENEVMILVQDHLLHKVHDSFDSCESIGQILNVEPIE